LATLFYAIPVAKFFLVSFSIPRLFAASIWTLSTPYPFQACLLSFLNLFEPFFRSILSGPSLPRPKKKHPLSTQLSPRSYARKLPAFLFIRHSPCLLSAAYVILSCLRRYIQLLPHHFLFTLSLISPLSLAIFLHKSCLKNSLLFMHGCGYTFYCFF